ncbi:N-acetyltransferase [Streptomyces verrucosisporus]|uniref:GNAT family N-acetyltransferase n=1 Tax=Streptomyces verrucosisporus TaxID=1695161 RepID=UPI0019D2B1FB|nr:GNAT family N-acetyltransferase [Streptomyces verrucosisporus]MBN3931689.1 N-acetyltransferase [Streptomyces verrucosisporus]
MSTASSSPVASAPLAVRPVRGRADTAAFAALPRTLHRGDPYRLPPAKGDQRALIDRRRNPFFEVGTAELFLARRGRKPVGRIAAAVDSRYQALHDARGGLFGLFECADDPEAAAALFDAAAGWLRERGLETMLGPLGFSVHDECGVLVEGFDGPPTVMMPYNPAYYPALYTACGLTKAKDLLSWRVPVPPGGEPPGPAARAARWAADAPDVRLRHLDPCRLEADLAVVRDIYADAWSGNYASVPMTGREFSHAMDRLRPLVRPELVWFAEVRGEPVAFTFWLPDVNQALHATRDTPPGRSLGRPLGRLRTARAVRRVDRARVILTGVRAAHRARGLTAALLAEAQRSAFRLGCAESEFSWLLEDNRDANRYAQAFGGVLHRRHRLYRRDLAPRPAAAASSTLSPAPLPTAVPAPAAPHVPGVRR